VIDNGILLTPAHPIEVADANP